MGFSPNIPVFQHSIIPFISRRTIGFATEGSRLAPCYNCAAESGMTRSYANFLQNPKIWSQTFCVDCSGGMTFQKSDFGRSSRK
jgi:hypothetical protein